MINKKSYYEANKSHLGVTLRRFQQWFYSKASDKELIKAKTKPKPEMVRKQNKVEFQVDRTRYTQENKLDLIMQYDRQKAANPGLTQKEFCSLQTHLRGDHGISWKRRKCHQKISFIIGSEQADNIVQICTYKIASILIYFSVICVL